MYCAKHRIVGHPICARVRAQLQRGQGTSHASFYVWRCSGISYNKWVVVSATSLLQFHFFQNYIFLKIFILKISRDCGHHYQACKKMRIMYAWAKNAPPTTLPKDVGFRIGPESNIKNLVLQVHYAHPLPVGSTDKSGYRLHYSSEE